MEDHSYALNLTEVNLSEESNFENNIEKDDKTIWTELLSKFYECSASAKRDTIMLQKMLQPNVQNSPTSTFPTCIEHECKSEKEIMAATSFPDLESHPLFSRNLK